MILFLLFAISMMAVMFYIRYFPVSGVAALDLNGLDLDKQIVVDIRNFNESTIYPLEGSTNIPYAYLIRNWHEIPKGMDIVLGVSSTLDINIGTRFLRRRGFNIAGYIMASPVNQQRERIAIKIENC